MKLKKYTFFGKKVQFETDILDSYSANLKEASAVDETLQLLSRYFIYIFISGANTYIIVSLARS